MCVRWVRNECRPICGKWNTRIALIQRYHFFFLSLWPRNVWKEKHLVDPSIENEAPLGEQKMYLVKSSWEWVISHFPFRVRDIPLLPPPRGLNNDVTTCENRGKPTGNRLHMCVEDYEEKKNVLEKLPRTSNKDAAKRRSRFSFRASNFIEETFIDEINGKICEPHPTVSYWADFPSIHFRFQIVIKQPVPLCRRASRVYLNGFVSWEKPCVIFYISLNPQGNWFVLLQVIKETTSFRHFSWLKKSSLYCFRIDK